MKPLKLSFASILIGSALLLSGASESSAPRQNPSKETRTDERKTGTHEVKKAAPKQPEQPTPFQTEILETLRAIKDEIKTNAEKYYASQEYWYSPSVLLQIFLVAVGIFYTIFAACQWWATRTLADLERPWIMIEQDWPITAETPMLGENKIRWSAVNVGRSPAFLNRISVKPDIVEYPLPYDRPKDSQTEDFSKFILGPGKKHTHEDPFTIDDVQWQGLFDGNRCVVFYGVIDYLDTSEHPHQTRFCAYWHLQNNHWQFSPVGPPDWIKYT